MNANYEDLLKKLKENGISKAKMNQPNALMVFEPHRVALTLTFYKNNWYLITWSPRVYKIPSQDRVLALCLSFNSPTSHSVTLLYDTIDKFSLILVDDGEIDEILDWAFEE